MIVLFYMFIVNCLFNHVFFASFCKHPGGIYNSTLCWVYEIFPVMCTISLLTKYLTLEHNYITFTSVCVKQLSITITNARVKQLKKESQGLFYSRLKVSVHRQSDSLLLILWQCLCGILWKHRCSPFSSWAAEREKVEGPGFQYSFFFFFGLATVWLEDF